MVTIIDVARAAGVAPSTVSYVLNGKRPISADTRRQVEECIRRLGYRPANRRSPAPRRRTNVLGLLGPLRRGVNLPALTRFVTATMIAANARDHDLLLLTQDGGMAGLRRAMSSAIADALIVIDIGPSDPRIPALMALDRPVVLVGRPDHPVGLARVDLDFGPAADRAVEHLVELGHRTVGLLGSSLPGHAWRVNYPQRFTRAFETAAGKRGLRVQWRPCGDSSEAVRSCLDALFAEHSGVTGLVVENEVALPGVLHHLRRRGYRIPEDISVVAACHSDVADRPPVGLTSVGVPTDELGEIAVELALHQLGQGAPEVRLISPALAIRESTGLAPGPPARAKC